MRFRIIKFIIFVLKKKLRIMATITLNHGQKEFRNKYGLCNVYFAIKTQKDGSAYCPGIYNLKAPVLSPKQFAYSRR